MNEKQSLSLKENGRLGFLVQGMGVGIRLLTERGDTETAEDAVFNSDSLGLISRSCLRHRLVFREEQAWRESGCHQQRWRWRQ